MIAAALVTTPAVERMPCDTAEEGYALDLAADSPEGLGEPLKDRIAETERFTDGCGG
jgi:hypothetical protein